MYFQLPAYNSTLVSNSDLGTVKTRLLPSSKLSHISRKDHHLLKMQRKYQLQIYV